jgi:hypothetical protein
MEAVREAKAEKYWLFYQAIAKILKSNEGILA